MTGHTTKRKGTANNSLYLSVCVSRSNEKVGRSVTASAHIASAKLVVARPSEGERNAPLACFAKSRHNRFGATSAALLSAGVRCHQLFSAHSCVLSLVR